MPLDTFICGTCMVSFNDIEQFILHKNDLCGKTTDAGDTIQIQAQQIPVSADAVSVITNELSEVTGEIPLEVSHHQGGTVSTVSLPGSETLLSNASELFQAGNQQTVIILQGDLPAISLENAGQLLAEVTQDKPNIELLAGLYKKKGKPGRPKKSKVSEKDVKSVFMDKKEKNEPEIGEDGKLTCRRCKKAFSRERVFNAHKCIAISEYVDFTTKEVPTIDPDDNDMPQDDIEDAGALDMDYMDAEFKMPPNIKREMKQDNDDTSQDNNETGYPEMKVELDDTIDEDVDVTLKEAAERADNQSNDGANVENSEQSSALSNNIAVQLEGGPDTEEHARETDKIGTVPMFLNDADKAQFEACLNIDLSGVDHMFRTHCIQQELNQNVQPTSRFSTTELSLFSCNTCDKVFKSIPHMRFHVLIHTELKPFRCFKCNYASNSRGNLYTHMRKHTGQYYFCDHCKFKTVNKSHLVEHQQTHNGSKEQCTLCRKMYNTQKSLMSHIRKYHDNQKGKAYLATFMQGRDIRGTTIIHQCHVCNRKFKKKTDRDRHLFVHDIKDISVVQHCDLCNYAASRPKYLEKHFQKHRCIYRCCKCTAMFLSSVKLVEHLTTSHTETSDSMTWEQLFEESIASSLYLPEPDNALPTEEKEFVNLPQELSETGVNEGWKLHNTGEDYLPLAAADLYINKEPAVTVEENESSLGVKETADTQTDSHVAMETSDIIICDSDVNNDDMSGLKTLADSVIDADDIGNVETGAKSGSEELMLSEENEHSTITSHSVTAELVNVAADSIDTLQSNVADGSSEMAGNNMSVDETLEGAVVSIPETAKEFDDNSETPVLEETNLTEEELLGNKRKSLNAKKLIEKLGYQSMTLRIFKKMRDTFGSEECEYCGRLFFSRMDYEPHVRTHTGDKPFLCPKCGYRSITKENLKRHIDKEHMNITYPCRDCAYVAYTRTQLWNHAMKHKGLKGLECPSCREQFETMTELKEHAEQIHPNANIEELDKLLSNKHKIQGKIGRRSYKCPHCDKVFVRASSELQKHMWIHEGIKPFKCPLCPYACRSKNNLQAHMLRHSKDKPFLCGDCGKAYKSKTALRWHVRAHASGKLFKCDKCPYEATQRSHLKRHMETHDVIKRYVCGECQFSANTLGFLKVHYARFHKGIDTTNLMGLSPGGIQITQDVNTYKCLSCAYLFGNLSDLKRHLKTRHHVNVKDLHKVEDSQGGVQVVHLEEGEGSQEQEFQVMTTDGQESHIVTDENLDEKTASAVNILQQIIGMSQNGGITQEVDGSSVVTMNPETIIVEQAGTEMYISSDNTTTTEIDGNHYVIQYIPQTEAGDGIGIVEVQGEEVEAEVLTEAEVMS